MKACWFTKPGAGAPPVAKHPFELDIGTAASLWAREERFKSIPKGFKIPGRAAVPPLINLYPFVIDPAPEIERHDGLARLVIGAGGTMARPSYMEGIGSAP